MSGKAVLKFKSGPIDSVEIPVEDLAALLNQLNSAPVAAATSQSAVERPVEAPKEAPKRFPVIAPPKAPSASLPLPLGPVTAGEAVASLADNGKTFLLTLYDHPEGMQGAELASKLGLTSPKGLGPVVFAVFNWGQKVLWLSRKQMLTKVRHRAAGDKSYRVVNLADPLRKRMRDGLADAIKNSL